MGLLTTEDKDQHIQNNPELALLKGKEFSSYRDFSRAALKAGIEPSIDDYKYFNPRFFDHETGSHPDDTLEQTLKVDGHSTHIYANNYRSRFEMIDRDYRSTVENAVSDWNRENPRQKIEGKTFIKSNGDWVINPTVKDRLKNINKHAGDVLIEVHGESAYEKYQKSIAEATYNNVSNDPQFQEMEKNIADRLRTQTENREFNQSQLDLVEENIRKDEVAKFIQNNPKKSKLYSGKRKYGRQAPWFKRLHEQQLENLKKSYSSPDHIKTIIDQKTQKRISEEVDRLKQIDIKNGEIPASDDHYRKRVNEASIKLQVQSEEIEKTREIAGRRAQGLIKKSIEKDTEQLRDQDQLFQEQAKEQIEKATNKEEYLNRIRDPKEDPRVERIKSSVSTDAQKIYEAEIQLKINELTEERNKKRLQNVPGRPIESDFEIHQRAKNSVTSNLGELEAKLKQRRLEAFFRDHPNQAETYSRKDPEIKTAYDEWIKKNEHAIRRQNEAYNLTKKRSLYKRLYHRVRPPKREYLQPDGSETRPATFKQSRFSKFKKSLGIKTTKIRNAYDRPLQRISLLNYKYNPYEIAKREYSEAKERFKKLLQQYTRTSIRRTGSVIKYPARASIRLAGRGVSAGLNAAGRSATARLGSSVARLGVQAAGTAVKAVSRWAIGVLLLNPITWIVIIVVIILLIVLLPEDNGNADIEVTIDQAEDIVNNVEPNVYCFQQNVSGCLGSPGSNVRGAHTSILEQDVLQATSAPEDNELTTEEKVNSIYKDIQLLAPYPEQYAEFYNKIKDSLVRYTITTTYPAPADDVETQYTIPDNVVFISASGNCQKSTGDKGAIKLTWLASQQDGTQNCSIINNQNSSASARLTTTPAPTNSSSSTTSSVSFSRYTQSPYNLPTPSGQSDRKYTGETLDRLNHLGSLVSKNQSFILSQVPGQKAEYSDPFLSVIWNGPIEGIDGDPYYWNCRDTSSNINAGCSGGYYSGGWQVGYGIQVSQAASRLATVFEHVHGDPNSASNVQKVGQAVISNSGGKISNPSTFPSESVSSLVSKANSGNTSAQQAVAILLMDEDIGAIMIQLEVASDIASRNNWNATMQGWGSYYVNNMQNFSNRAAELAKGYTGSSSGSGSSGSDGFYEQYELTVLPVDSDYIVESPGGNLFARVINPHGGTGDSSSDNSTPNGNPTDIINWAQQINNNLAPGIWGYYNKMTASIKNGGVSATIRNATTEAYENGEQLSTAGLYWCTFIVIDAYNLSGKTGLKPESHLAVMDMIPFFANTSGYVYLNYNDDYNTGKYPANKQNLTKVKQGYAFFMMNHYYSGGHTGQEHTGLVKNINLNSQGDGYIDTLESNSNAKTHRFIIDGWNITNTAYPIRGFGGY